MKKQVIVKKIKRSSRKGRFKDLMEQFFMDLLALFSLLIVPAALFLHWLFFGYPL